MLRKVVIEENIANLCSKYFNRRIYMEYLFRIAKFLKFILTLTTERLSGEHDILNDTSVYKSSEE